jgi:LacI family transcriptional regulator
MMDLGLLDKRKSSKQQAGLHVPGDIALAGFDDVRDSANTDPPLTTAHMPKLEMGVVAGQRLIDLILHPLPDGPP